MSKDFPDTKRQCTQARYASELERLREDINAMDGALLEALNRRAGLSLEVGRLKADFGAPVLQPERERALLDNLIGRNAGPLPEEHVRSIYSAILASSRSLQQALGQEQSGTTAYKN